MNAFVSVPRRSVPRFCPLRQIVSPQPSQGDRISEKSRFEASSMQSRGAGFEPSLHQTYIQSSRPLCFPLRTPELHKGLCAKRLASPYVDCGISLARKPRQQVPLAQRLL